jgi:hypothetical protein
MDPLSVAFSRLRQVSSEKPLAHSPATAFGSVNPMDPLAVALFGGPT